MSIINEIVNPIYKITPITMKNDKEIKNVKPPLPQFYNFALFIVGPPGSGKTTFFLNLISKSKHSYYKKFNRVYIFSNSLHTITQKIKLPDERLFTGIDELENVVADLAAQEERALIILDDVISDVKDDKFFKHLFYNRRHIGGGISLMIISQVYNRFPLSLRKALSHLAFFNNSNKKELKSVFDDFIYIIIRCDEKTFDAITDYIFDDKHNFMFLEVNDKIFYKNFNRLEIKIE